MLVLCQAPPGKVRVVACSVMDGLPTKIGDFTLSVAMKVVQEHNAQVSAIPGDEFLMLFDENGIELTVE